MMATMHTLNLKVMLEEHGLACVLRLGMLLAIFTTIADPSLSLPKSKKVLLVSVAEQGEQLLEQVKLKKLILLKMLLKKLPML